MQNLLFLISVLFFCQNSFAQLPSALNFNTASNASATGTVPFGANDLNWTAALTNSVGPYVPAVSCGNQAPCCWVNSPASNVNWITYPHTCSGSPAEHACLGSVDEFYKLSFNLPSNNPCGQSINQPNAYCLGIDFYSDNCVYEIFVNGVSKFLSGVASPYFYMGFSSGNQTSVTMCNGWQAGNNNVIVHVKSGANPFPTWTGFLAVVNLSLTSSVSSYSTTTVNINPSYSICAGSSATLTASGATNYTWSPGGSNASSVVVSPLSTTIYTVTGSNGSCVNTATTQISIGSSLVVSNSGPICSGASATLTASGLTNYTWSPGGFTGSSISVSPSSSTTYTVLGTSNSCTDVATTSLLVNSAPTLTATVTPTSICSGNSATLNVNGATNYTWMPGNLTGSSIVVNPTTSTNYTVTGSNGNCSGVSQVSLNVIATPTTIASSSGNGCIGDIIDLFSSGPSTYNYQWTGPNGFSSAIQNPTLIATSLATSGTYSVTIDNAGCFSNSSVVVNIGSFTPAQISSGAIAGCASFCTSYSVQNPSSGNISWMFDDGSSGIGNGITHCFTTPGTHSLSVIVSNTTGCNSAGSFSVTVYPKPTADFNFGPIKPITDEEVTFTDASYDNIISWNWYLMNTAQYTSVIQNTTFTYPDAGTYPVALVVKNNKGCLDTIIKVITVIEDYVFYIPNTFTPNNDGLNEIFQPKGTGIKKYEMLIFDRWGEKIFETKEFEKGWDGKYQGKGDKICPSDVYTYQIKLTNVNNKNYDFAGHVTLLK